MLLLSLIFYTCLLKESLTVVPHLSAKLFASACTWMCCGSAVKLVCPLTWRRKAHARENKNHVTHWHFPLALDKDLPEAKFEFYSPRERETVDSIRPFLHSVDQGLLQILESVLTYHQHLSRLVSVVATCQCCLLENFSLS